MARRNFCLVIQYETNIDQWGLAISEKMLGTEYPNMAITLGSLAKLYRIQDRYDPVPTGAGNSYEGFGSKAPLYSDDLEQSCLSSLDSRWDDERCTNGY